MDLLSLLLGLGKSGAVAATTTVSATVSAATAPLSGNGGDENADVLVEGVEGLVLLTQSFGDICTRSWTWTGSGTGTSPAQDVAKLPDFIG